MKKGIGIVIGAVILLLLGIYWRLGGFNPVQIFVNEQEDLKLLGITYRGTPQDPGMSATFQKVEEVINRYTGSHLHTIYYTEPAGKLDTLEVFVGVEFAEEIIEKENLEVKEISCSQVVVAELQAHRLVMPNPETVKQQIEDFAKERHIPLRGIFVDKIINNNRVDVIAPILPE